MALTINHNMMVLNAGRNLTVPCGALGTMTQLLSSGIKFNFSVEEDADISVSKWMYCGQINGIEIIITYFM